MAEMERQPSALVWNWRRAAAGAGDSRSPAAAAAARRQGAIGAAVGLGVAAVFAWLLHRPVPALVVAALSLTVALLALAAPLTLYRRLRGALDRGGHWVGTGVTWLLMTVLFYLLFLPAGLIMRAMGKLAFTRFADPALDTYWTPTEGRVHSAESYRKQF
jgi:predicted membrane channel-forming protein YqfA (hemolysin III family)